MEPLSPEYDFVVLGEHPAGLWAAKHLLGLGQKVLIIPMGAHSGVNVIPRAAASTFQIPEREFVSRELNPIQVIADGRRVKVMPTFVEFQEEIQFNYGKKLQSNEGPVPNLLRGLSYLVRGSETGPVFPDDWSFISSRLFDTVYFEKEKGWLVRTLLQDLRDLGASVTQTKNLRQVFVDKKMVVGIQLSGTSKMIPVKAALINAQFDLINQFFNEPLALHSSPISWNFEIQFECGLDFLPIGLTTRLIYVERDAPILDILHESPGKFRLKTTLPLNPESLDRGEQRRLAERMLKVAESLLPDLEYNIKKVVPDLRDPDRSMTVELPVLYPFQDLRRIPTELLNYASGSGFGFQTAHQNLYITQEEAYPRLGVWGGYQAAAQALEAYGKREQKLEFTKVSLDI